MENNTNTIETTENTELTSKEIFDQIVALQNELTETQSLQNMIEAIRNVCINGDVSNEGVESIAAPFAQREETLQIMLTMYEKMYYDMQQKKSRARKEKIDTIKNLWLSYLDKASNVADEDGRIEIINYVQSQINLLAIDIMDDKI